MHLSPVDLSNVLVLALICVGSWHKTESNSPPMSCEVSRRTLVSVDKCPENKSQWDQAAETKDCRSVKQSCTESDKFVYHCLINAWENATMEVCAPRVNIIGKCVEYNTEGAVVQEHARLSCVEFNHPCPTYYLSDEAYLYQGCYSVVNRNKLITTKAVTNKMHDIGSGKRLMHVTITMLLTFFYL